MQNKNIVAECYVKVNKLNIMLQVSKFQTLKFIHYFICYKFENIF